MLSIENSPKLRFKDINGKDYAKWKENKLEQLPILILDGNYGELYPKADELLNDGIPFIRVNNLKDSKIVNKDMKYISKELHNILLSGHLKFGDVLISTRGEIGITAYVEKEYDDANINAQLCLIRVTNSYLNSKFLLYLFQNDNVQKQFKKLQTGSVLKQLPKRNLVKLKVNVPVIEEQQKISKFFSEIDNLISKYTYKLDIIENLKKSLLQKLFPKEGETNPEFRFPGFNDDWVQSKLKDLASFLSGNGLNRNAITDNGKYECILYGHLYTDYGMIADKVFFKTDIKINSPVYSEYGDVLIPASDTTPTGLARATSIEKAGVLLGGDINIIRPNKDINGSCLSLAINANKKSLLRLIKGTTVRHINNSDIQYIDISLPKDPLEQDKIRVFFKKLDKNISLHKRKLEILQKIKKSLLQQMFV